MKRYFTLLPLLLMTSCATIMHGTTQRIGIASNPSYADVWIDYQYVGQTPLAADLSRNQGHFIHIELEGYLPYDIICTRQLSGWVFGNIVFGGVIGLCVDAVSGGIYRLTPEQVHAQLHEERIVHRSKDGNSYFAIVLEPDPSWEKIGQLEKKS